MFRMHLRYSVVIVVQLMLSLQMRLMALVIMRSAHSLEIVLGIVPRIAPIFNLIWSSLSSLTSILITD